MRSQKRQDPKVQPWVATAGYIVCWAGGFAIAYTAEPGDVYRLVAGGVLILFPLAPFSPVELVRAWRSGGSE